MARSSYGVIVGLVLVLLMLSVVTDDWQGGLWGLVLIAIAGSADQSGHPASAFPALGKTHG